MEFKPRSFLFNRILMAVLIALYLAALGFFTYMNIRSDPEFILWHHLVNILILSIPLVLFFGAIYVLVTAWRERRQAGSVSQRLAKVIFWAPRAASIAIIFFVSLFSLDVFGTGSVLEQIGGFLIHNIPSFVMILMLVFAWRRPVIGFGAFLLAGIVFLRFVLGGGGLGHFLLFSGPLLLVSALFYADWRLNRPALPAQPVSPA